MSSSAHSVLASKLADLKQKATKIEVVEVETPVNALDLLTQFKSASGGYKDTANEFIVDVFPNFMPIICYVMMLANRVATMCDYKTHAKASPPTIIMYYMFLIYGYFLIVDTSVRPQASVHARLWKTDSSRKEFLDFLKSLPVPDDLVFILQQFAPSATERSGNIFFIPSFAGFSHHHFFGKFIPVKAFSDIHNTVVAMPGNSTPGSIYKHLFKNALYTAGNVTVTLFALLGLNAPTAATILAPATRLFQVFEAVFNPVLFRDFHRRSSLARIPISAPEFDDINYNAYDAILSFNEGNSSEYQVVLRSIASILQGTVTMKKSLSEIVSESSGISILHHGYSLYPCPVSAFGSKTAPSSFTKDTELDSSSMKTYADSIGYLKKSAIPKDNHPAPEIKVIETSSGKDASTTHRVKKDQFPLTTVTDEKSSASDGPDVDKDFIYFDVTQHVSPRVRVLDILNTGTTDAYLATLSGKVIETFEIDGTTIALPNLDQSLGLENSQFADSAFPIVLALQATTFAHNVTTPPVPPRRRHVEREDLRFSASHLFIDRTVVNLPNMTVAVRDPTPPSVGPAYPGLTGLLTNFVSATQSFFGLKTIAPDASSSTSEELVNTPKHKYYVWSPYTLTTLHDRKPERSSSQYSRIYFLVNLRTLLGTDYNLVEINGSFHAMPIS